MLLVLLVGCSGEDEVLPTDTTILINPVEKDWLISPNSICVDQDFLYQDELITIQLTDGSGRPLSDVELLVSLNLAGNTFNGITAVELYEDQNGNFIPEEEELVSGDNNTLFITRTEDITGHKNLIVRLNLSCTYRSVLTVSAQGFTASTEFTVSFNTTEEPDE